MSINVTVNGNPVSINRGRMVLNDLDEIKKNERDRRRKLRLEQVSTLEFSFKNNTICSKVERESKIYVSYLLFLFCLTGERTV